MRNQPPATLQVFGNYCKQSQLQKSSHASLAAQKICALQSIGPNESSNRSNLRDDSPESPCNENKRISCPYMRIFRTRGRQKSALVGGVVCHGHGHSPDTVVGADRSHGGFIDGHVADTPLCDTTKRADPTARPFRLMFEVRPRISGGPAPQSGGRVNRRSTGRYCHY